MSEPVDPKLLEGLRAAAKKIGATVIEDTDEVRKLLGIREHEPVTPLDAVEAWDAGETLWSIEMGGLGPGYEQAIQVFAIEILRDHGGKPTPSVDDFRAMADATLDRCDQDLGGLSGAMFGAGLQLAYKAMRDGWSGRNQTAREQFKREKCEDRMIQISKHWPKGKDR